MFSKRVCASLCALGMLGAVNANTKVSAAGTFQSIAGDVRSGSYLWGCLKIMLGYGVFCANKIEHDRYSHKHKGVPYLTITGLSAFLGLDGILDAISACQNLDEAKIKTFEAIAKNDPVYSATYKFLKCAPVELTDENVKGVIDNVKKAREVYKKFKDRDLDPAQRLLAKDEYVDAVENLKEIAGKKNSEGNDEQTSGDKPQLYKRRNR